jgi:pimeloyl-ACP methyl ester carboxylesterase
MTTSKATIVLVHGAWHGSWCWQRVTPLLEARGIAARTVDLPSVGAAPGAGTDLSADAAAVEKVIESLDGPVVLCGHSYGGMVISRVEAKSVTRLVYLCAFMPAEGQSLVGTGDGKPAPWIQLLNGGLMQPDPTRSGDLFYSDCDPETKEWARSKIRSQSAATVLEPVARPAWRRVPSTYVVCTNDMAMFADIQRNVFAPRASEVIELQASHSPFLSQPQAVAEILAAKAGAPSHAATVTPPLRDLPGRA